MRRFSMAGLLCASVFGVVLAAAFAGQPDAARLPIHATVISVDSKHATVVVEHAALETMPAGKRKCQLRHPADVKRLHPGTIIEASADTRHQTWTLDHVRVKGGPPAHGEPRASA
ncbi:MAG: copper-binding protein [Candidatus Eremiobacteraeota bacterium]|nr:copper-binding protein [Candidatus Eremiobacteraeota bacterium]